MTITRILVLLIGIIYTEAKSDAHVDIYLTGCTDSDGEDMYGLDGEEKTHADFIQKKMIMTLPEFADQYQYEEGTYEGAVGNQQVCKQNLDVAIKSYKNPKVAQAPPSSSLYLKDEVKLGVTNTLICFITGMYPPRLTVAFTKNNNDVTGGVGASQMRVNLNDGTFSQVYTMKFIPQEGDLYTCTVNHDALDRPMTREFDVEVPEPSVGPSVFCGVGLTLGLVGVATGTFFLVKGNQCN